MRDSIIDIPKDDPFKNDEFGRKVIAENFMKIFDADKDGIVLAIDSDWGTGKTTFIKMWESLINNDIHHKNNYETVYFNAWDNDYMEDPLLALFTEVQSKKETEDITAEVLDEIFSPVLVGLKRFVDIGLKLKSSGAVGIEDFDFKKALDSKNVEEKMISMGDEVLSRAINARQLRDKFKQEIENSQKQSDDKQETKKKIIFFIDELDRCRPKFAIELLETIKHLFSVPGIIFVISLDKNQLSHSVATIYGQNMDTVGYLRRFFDLEYRIPKPDKKKYLDIKNETYLNGYYNTKFLKVFLKSFMSELDFSLRDIDKAYFYVDKLIPLIQEHNEEFCIAMGSRRFRESYLITTGYLYAYMICMKIKHEDLYKKIINIDYKNDDALIENEFMIKELRNIDFNGNDKDVYKYGNDYVDNVLFYYLKLNYLSNTSSGLRTISHDDFKIGVASYDQFSMVELFNEDNTSQIINNIEFVSNFKDK